MLKRVWKQNGYIHEGFQQYQNGLQDETDEFQKLHNYDNNGYNDKDDGNANSVDNNDVNHDGDSDGNDDNDVEEEETGIIILQEKSSRFSLRIFDIQIENGR